LYKLEDAILALHLRIFIFSTPFTIMEL